MRAKFSLRELLVAFTILAIAFASVRWLSDWRRERKRLELQASIVQLKEAFDESFRGRGFRPLESDELSDELKAQLLQAEARAQAQADDDAECDSKTVAANE